MTGERPTESSGVVAALRADLERRVASRPDVVRRDVGRGVEYEIRGRPFASADAGSLSFRLASQVARAAAGTTGASISPLGPDWVRFAPTELDRFSLDRAAAWFDHALRLADEARGD